MSDTTASSDGDWIPDFFIVGPQKCATTWMYEGLAEHPEVYVPDTDSVHYFDMHYHEGLDWYRDFFPDNPEGTIGEETPSYIRSEATPKRIADLNPDAKIIFSVRDPVDRAFSHYWHEKSKGKHSFEFNEVFENYDLFENWVVPGMYYSHIQRFEEYFDENQMKIMVFDDLIANDKAFIQEVYDFIEVDSSFRPSTLDERVNEARQSFGIEAVDKLYYGAVNSVYRNADERVKSLLRPFHQLVQGGGPLGMFQSKTEYEEGMSTSTRRRLEAMYVEEINRLSDRTGRSFGDWFKYTEYEN